MTERKSDNLTADLSAYLDGELDEQRRHEVEEFLAESADARRALDELRTVSGQIAALPRRRAPATVTFALAARAEDRLLVPNPLPSPRMRTVRLFAQVAATAAALAACVFIGYEVRDYPGATSRRPAVTRGARDAHCDRFAQAGGTRRNGLGRSGVGAEFRAQVRFADESPRPATPCRTTAVSGPRGRSAGHTRRSKTTHPS